MPSLSINISPQNYQYDIDFFEDIASTKSDLQEIFAKKSGIIITDENIVRTDTFQRIFGEYSKQTLVLPAGESTKSQKNVEKILEFAFEHHLQRGSIIIGVGGGVIGDVTGFAASIYLRGIDMIQVPTSLLAMVDSSIGGKTGINSTFGKNLIGTFAQPKRVIIIKNFLNSLPQEEIKNGLCEMIKHACIASKEHFENLEKIAKIFPNTDEIYPLIADSITIKKDIVQADEKETKGKRVFLNFGHTIGHAVEHLSKYKIPHGQAVAIGCMAELKIGIEKNITSQETVKKIAKIFTDFGIDTVLPYKEKELLSAMTHDKKNCGKKAYIYVPQTVGIMAEKPLEIGI